MADPSTIPSLVNRWRADSVAQTNGTAVSSWVSLTGGVSLAQATGTAQPSYIVSGINSLPVVRFNGTSDNMSATITARAQPHTVALVLKAAVATGTLEPIDIGNPQILTSGTAWAQWEGTANITGGTFNTSATVLTAVGNGASSVLYQNGASVATGNPGTAASSTVALVGSTSGSRWFNGDIAEVLWFSSGLSAGDRATVHTYVQDRYGITVSDYIASPPRRPLMVPRNQSVVRSSAW